MRPKPDVDGPAPLPSQPLPAVVKLPAVVTDDPRADVGVPLLEVADLTVRFPRVAEPALLALGLRVGRGERVLVVGPSGSGKSTLLRVLAGIVPHSVRAVVTGTVRLDGAAVDEVDVEGRSRWCGYLAQDPATSVCLAQVDDEVAFPLENRAVPPAETTARVASILEEHGLDGLARRATSALSGGQLQRVALAAALVSRPDLLLLDEPTALLDPASAHEVARAVDRLGSSAEPPAVVLVEHRLDELADAGALPPRVLVLGRGGRVVADGPTAGTLRAHARSLARDGTWLPLDVELEVATGSARTDVTALAELARLGALAGAPPPTETTARTSRGVTARGLTVLRGDRPALTDVDLDLRPGEVTAVLGRNGTGKTSLLLALAGLLPPRDVARGVITSGSVGLVFQRPEHQFVARTVGEEVARGSEPALAARFLREMGLDDLRDRDPYRLSGGQQRRLSLAAVAAQGHDALLADEPTFGLDRRHTYQVAAILRGLAHEGRAVLLSTHDVRLAALIADRLVVLDRGRVRAAGPVEEVLRSGAPEEAGMPLPRLLREWMRASGVPLRDLLRGLDAAVEQAVAIPSAALTSRETLVPSFRDMPRATPEGEGALRAVELGSGHRPVELGSGPRPVELGSGPRPAWLQRRNPAVKLCVLLALTSTLMLVLDPLIPAALYAAFTLAAPAAAGVSPLRVLRAQIPLFSFALGLFAVNAVTRGGEVVGALGPLDVTDDGLVTGAALALRMAAIASAAVLFVLSTDAVVLLRSLEQQLRVPPRTAYAVLATHRLLETMAEEWALALAAQKIRRGRIGSAGKAKELATAAFALLVGALRRGERLAVALETRGLGEGGRSHWRPLRVTAGDWVLVAAALVLLGLVVLAHVSGGPAGALPARVF